ncbi:hypothetical protein MHH37_16790 [Solibacillus sp. FSL K6-1781]|uniref:hypothetical protein n=1 Tax=Solibacillus sp. FSL K6-1781 TaxID=2921474 RepID=UPI00315A3EF0
MQGYPEENELLSLFECEPTFLDSPSDAIDFFYTEATYKFSNGNEDFIVTISPSYSEVKIRVTNCSSKNLITMIHIYKRLKLK